MNNLDRHISVAPVVVKYLLVLALLLQSTQAWSCTCFGTASIEETIATHPNLVEAQVENVSFDEVTLRVSRVLKGRVTSSTIQIGHWMCYASLYPKLMKLNHTYVLPLGEPAAELRPAEETEPGVAIISVGEPKPGEYTMPGCAESGFELADGRLYTFEPTIGEQRRLQRYGDYSYFLRWRPIIEVLAMLSLFFLTSLEFVAERLGPVLAIILLVLCICAPAIMLARLTAEQRRRLMAFVFALPVLWLLIGLCGCVLRYPDLSSIPPVHDPGGPIFLPLAGLVLFFCFAVIFSLRLSVGRAFAASYSLVNAYFAVMMCLFSVMAIGGVRPTPWL